MMRCGAALPVGQHPHGMASKAIVIEQKPATPEHDAGFRAQAHQTLSPSPDVARVFLALLPGDEVKAALAVQRDQWQWPEGAVCYAPEDWHLTLHFIGAVPRSRLDELCAGLVVPMQPFELKFAQPELWQHGLAVWCPLTVPEELRQLHSHLGEALRQLGLKTDPRPYRPHITLARHAARAQAPLAAHVLDWQVRSYALMESTGSAALRYRVLKSYSAITRK